MALMSTQNEVCRKVTGAGVEAHRLRGKFAKGGGTRRFHYRSATCSRAKELCFPPSSSLPFSVATRRTWQVRNQKPSH